MTTALRRTIILVFGLALLGAALARGGTANVDVTAAIAGSDTSYRLTATNTGTEPVKCFGLLLDGVQPTSATGPAGVLTRVGTFQGRGLVHMQGDVVIPPGGTATVDFRTNIPIPVNAGGEIRYSATCQPGSDVVGRATGPPAPTPIPKPCKCKALTARIGKSFEFDRRRSKIALRLQFDLDWKLKCTAGTGGCKGTIRVQALPQRSVPDAPGVVPHVTPGVVPHLTPKNGLVTCIGTCGGTTESFKRFAVLDTDLGLGNRGSSEGTRSWFLVKRACAGKALRPLVLAIAYIERTGGVSLKDSDLDGDGLADGTGDKVL